jgi:glycolate oxidase iron-sulfur subunit
MSEHHTGPADALKAEEAGLLACVHCGFCLNACPTYTRLGHEGDSPRGRLDLMRAVMEGRLEPDDPSFRLHIDRCLGCRACEPVCPSGVPYGFLLERARSAISRTAGVSWSTRLLIATFTTPLSGVATVGARVIRGLGLARLLARWLPASLPLPRFGMAMLAASAPWPGLRRVPSGAPPGAVNAPAQVPPTPSAPAGRRQAVDAPGTPAGDVAAAPERTFADPHALAGAYPAATGAGAASPPHPDVPTGTPRLPAPQDAGAAAGTRAVEVAVAVLTGCVQQALFARVNEATVRVLEANECRVVAAPRQRCCGALDAHAGRLERALELARANIAAFEASGAEVVVVNAAGCGAMMKEYAEQLRHDPEWAARAAAFTAKVRDVSEFLMSRPLRRGAPLPLAVTFDAPCHLHHAQRIRQAPLDLLDAIPGLDRRPLPDADECCGGAGLYGVHHPELGGRILADKVAAVRETGASVVTTPNPGCIMQIGAGLLLEGTGIPVLHPMELLDESYRRGREGT